MIHPQRTLFILLALATGAGAVIWPRFLEKKRQLEVPASVILGEPGRPEVGGTLVDQLGQPGKDAAGGNTTQDRQTSGLLEELEKLKKDNADLRSQLSKALIAKQPPPTIEDVLKQAEAVSGKTFKQKPEIKAVPLTEISKMVMTKVKAELPPAAAMLRTRAYQAMGFVNDTNFDFSETLAEIAAEQWPAWYDAEKNTVFYQDDADLRRMDGRYRLASGAFAALISQHCPAVKEMKYASGQDDAARALRAFCLGEVNVMRSLWDTQDSFMNVQEDTAGPSSLPPSSAAYYITEEHSRTANYGRSFVEYLMQSLIATELITNAYQRPPQSTTEIMHPELYLQNPPFSPTPIMMPDLRLGEQDPVYSNVVGELGLLLQISPSVSPELASQISEGWQGDRYWIYEGDPLYGPHVFWKTQWQTEKDAKEFMEAMCRYLPRRYNIPLKQEYFQLNTFTIKDPHRAIIVHRGTDKMSITVITASSVAMAEAMNQKFNTP